MHRDYFVELYKYNDWANRLVWECAMKTTEDDYFKDNTFSIGSIYTQLRHTLAVEQWWIGFLATGEIVFHSEEDILSLRDRDQLRRLWDEVNQSNLEYIQSVTDEELQRQVKPDFWDDHQQAITVSQALAQVANHSTDHRAQTMAALHMLGYDGVGQDFLMYLHRTD